MDIVKHYTYLDFSNFGYIPVEKNKYPTTSKNWVQWFTLITSTTCAYCASHHGHIFSVNDTDIIWPPVHERCRCLIIPLVAIPAGATTRDGVDGVDYYLFTHYCLPDNYITQKEAKLRGWKSLLGNLWDVLPGAVIGGGKYKNRDGKLPDKPGRIWYEADFDYNGGVRNAKRIVFSNDGLMFVTYNHYITFSEVYWEENHDDIYD